MSGAPRRDGPRPFNQGGRFEGPREEHREPPPPVALNVNLRPEEKGVEALARQIRLTGRAYPLFDIGQLILKKHDRYDVQLSVIKGADGKPVQPLFVCDLDDTLWLSEQEAGDHVLSRHFATFYQTEKIPTDPPKGVYTFVAQCGMSGLIFGPPNYHDYQTKLRKLHQERFARMPFDVFKARVKIVKDEAVVKKWVEEQSFRFEYVCLNVPETIKLNTREEVEKHFRETHLANVVKSVENRDLSGPAAHQQSNYAIRNVVRRAWEDQTRFPLKLVNVLSQQFASHGLQFFKLNGNVTYVAVSRPRYLDLEATPVSESVQRILEFIRHTPHCTRRKLFDALAGVSAAPGAASRAAAPVPVADATASPAETPVAPTALDADVSAHIAVINGDLHWLIHQGHVIEFANGILESARKPAFTPPKPGKKPAAKAPPAEPQNAAPTPLVQQTGEGDAGESSDADASSAEPDGAASASSDLAATTTEPAQAEQVDLSNDGSSQAEENSIPSAAASADFETASQPPAVEIKTEPGQMPVQAS